MKKKVIWSCLILIFLALGYSTYLWLKSHRSPQLLGKSVHRVKTDKKVVALTFDDGPSPHTKELLDILRAYEVPATFFLLGKNAAQYPHLVRQMYQAGHEIGNHSYSHEPLIFKSVAFIREEIEKTDQLIRQSGYQGTIHFRAPYGRKLIWLPWILYKAKRPHILFDVIPDDWASPGVETIVNRIVAQTKPGSIILCHDGNGDEKGLNRSQTVQAIPLVIEKLSGAGYQFVTISELLKLDEN
jgi:peptidoglycan-N-acetylglucosamine deacetylase